MIALMQNWIVSKIETGHFSKRRDVLLFALGRSLVTTVAAVILNFVVYQIFGRLGFMSVTLPPDPLADTVVTAFVAGPISIVGFYIVGSAIYDLSVSRTAFERLSRTDPLTGLLNRRAFVEHIAGIEGRYVLAVFDLDRFKAINDTHGHGAGDDILVAVSDMMREALGINAVARLGGEEFAAVLTGMTGTRAMENVDAVRQQLAAHVFRFEGIDLRITLSAGISESDGHTGYSMLLNQADKALYIAKASGRNRIVHANDIASIIPGNDAKGEKIAVGW